ncbi:MAG TPA: hypothetical protein VLT59_12935 [Steroidobacteraceae bacterium]|nr:hypothetical protein [Steroidobacteraceae bacterium]
MWKALLVLALVGLFLVGSLMTLKYTSRTGLPRNRLSRDDGRDGVTVEDGSLRHRAVTEERDAAELPARPTGPQSKDATDG